MMKIRRRLLPGLIGSTILVLANVVNAQNVECRAPVTRSSFGPFDYRTATKVQLATVEAFHFTAKVEAMQSGQSTSVLAADIAYTLRRFPNHHRALKTMGDWSLKVKRNPPPGGEVTVECWFERAIDFAPEDAMVKTIYGLYLIKSNKPKAGIEQLETALKQAGDDANVHYNLGLAYADMKEYNKALTSAHAAYRLGFPLPGLKNRLQRVGAWREPE